MENRELAPIVFENDLENVSDILAGSFLWIQPALKHCIDL